MCGAGPLTIRRLVLSLGGCGSMGIGSVDLPAKLRIDDDICSVMDVEGRVLRVKVWSAVCHGQCLDADGGCIDARIAAVT
jgi:hypothetical protein